VPRQVFVFDPPDRFVAGTVGQPGDRCDSIQRVCKRIVDATVALLEKYGAALVASDWPEFSTPLVATCDFLYIRRHGPGALYASSYDDDALEADLAMLRMQSADSAYVFFNNDIHGYAPWNAMRMLEMSS